MHISIIKYAPIYWHVDLGRCLRYLGETAIAST